MANTIKIKRSAVQGKAPATSDLQLGELGINSYDGKLYLKKDNGTESIVEVGALNTGIDALNDVTITSAASGQLLSYNGSQWVNTNTVQAAATGSIGLIVKGIAGQSVDIFNVGTSTTQATFRMLSTGALQQNANFTCIGTGLFQGFSAGATKPLVARAVASQTVSLFEVQNSSSTPLFSISKDGYLSAGSTYNGQLVLTGSFKIDGNNASETSLTIVSPNNGYGNTTLTLVRVPADAKWNLNTGAVGLNIVTGAFSWTGVGIDLASGVGPGAKLHINCDLASKKGFLIKANASQTASLFEIQDGSGNVLVDAKSDGTFQAKRTTQNLVNAFNTTLAPAAGSLTINTANGNNFVGALNASVSTWAFTNVSTDNSKITSVTVIIDSTATYTYGDACSVNGSSITDGVMWSGGSAPTATDNWDVIRFDIVKDSAGTIKVFGYGTTNFS